jgi:hypothetical protein
MILFIRRILAEVQKSLTTTLDNWRLQPQKVRIGKPGITEPPNANDTENDPLKARLEHQFLDSLGSNPSYTLASRGTAKCAKFAKNEPFCSLGVLGVLGGCRLKIHNVNRSYDQIRRRTA